MCFTIDQLEKACGLLLLNEFNTFIYCCKHCQREFEFGSNLEVHIWSEHQDDRRNVYEHGDVFVEEISFEPTSSGIERKNVKIESNEQCGRNEEFERISDCERIESSESNESGADEETRFADLLPFNGFDDKVISNERYQIKLKPSEVLIVKKRRGRPPVVTKNRNCESSVEVKF